VFNGLVLEGISDSKSGALHPDSWKLGNTIGLWAAALWVWNRTIPVGSGATED